MAARPRAPGEVGGEAVSCSCAAARRRLDSGRSRRRPPPAPTPTDPRCPAGQDEVGGDRTSGVSSRNTSRCSRKRSSSSSERTDESRGPGSDWAVYWVARGGKTCDQSPYHWPQNDVVHDSLSGPACRTGAAASSERRQPHAAEAPRPVLVVHMPHRQRRMAGEPAGELVWRCAARPRGTPVRSGSTRRGGRGQTDALARDRQGVGVGEREPRRRRRGLASPEPRRCRVRQHVEHAVQPAELELASAAPAATMRRHPARRGSRRPRASLDVLDPHALATAPVVVAAVTQPALHPARQGRSRRGIAPPSHVLGLST